MLFVKLPEGKWVNLAKVSSVDVEQPENHDFKHLIVRLVFDTGKHRIYCGACAVALLEVLTEMAHIDKT